jgi:hypothetical protein
MVILLLETLKHMLWDPLIKKQQETTRQDGTTQQNGQLGSHLGVSDFILL